jgi:hypothetical protein
MEAAICWSVLAALLGRLLSLGRAVVMAVELGGKLFGHQLAFLNGTTLEGSS